MWQLGIKMLKMCMHHPDDANQKAQCFRATQIQAIKKACADCPQENRWSCWALGERNQAVLVLLDPASLLHLAPSQPWLAFPAPQPILLSLVIHTLCFCLSRLSGQSPFILSTLLSSTRAPSSFLGSSLSTPPPSNPIMNPNNVYALFFQLPLQLPGRIFGYSLPFICPLVISSALPPSRSIPSSVSNIYILLP